MDKAILTRNLGLSEKEAAVYIAILELGSSTIQPIAKHSGIKRTSIYYFIDHLVELGLAETAEIRGRTHYKALPPDGLVALQERRLDEIKNALPQFASIFNVSTKKPKISYYEGTEQIQNIMLEETRCKEVLGIWPGTMAVDVVGGMAFMEKLDRLRRQKGVMLKVIRFRGKEVIFRGSAHGAEHLREIRFPTEDIDFPIAIGIYDTGKVGFITSKKEGFGIMLESEEIYQAMKFLFYLFWEKTASAAENEG